MNWTRWTLFGAIAISTILCFTGCSTVPVTGRHQLNMVSSGDEMQLGLSAFDQMKTNTPISRDPALNAMTDAVTHPTQPYVEMSFGMGKDGFPAISMTQHAANKYCQFLSAKTGHFYRLPTEAEWEYAARAGTTTAYFWGDDAGPIAEYCWYGKNSDFKYQKVGKKKPNPWGLHDMHGNVAEWVLDQHTADFYGKETGKVARDPLAIPLKEYGRVVRGGSWDGDPAVLRSAARVASTEEWKQQDPQIPQSIWYLTDALNVGFRIVRPLKEPSEEEKAAKWDKSEPPQIDKDKNK